MKFQIQSKFQDSVQKQLSTRQLKIIIWLLSTHRKRTHYPILSIKLPRSIIQAVSIIPTMTWCHRKRNAFIKSNNGCQSATISRHKWRVDRKTPFWLVRYGSYYNANSPRKKCDIRYIKIHYCVLDFAFFFTRFLRPLPPKQYKLFSKYWLLLTSRLVGGNLLDWR